MTLTEDSLRSRAARRGYVLHVYPSCGVCELLDRRSGFPPDDLPSNCNLEDIDAYLHELDRRDEGD